MVIKFYNSLLEDNTNSIKFHSGPFDINCFSLKDPIILKDNIIKVLGYNKISYKSYNVIIIFFNILFQ